MKQRFLEYPKSSIPKARENRQKQTEAEKTFWNLVRNNKLGVKFKRQAPFGPYILDFYCHSGMLAVELDGSQHYEKEGKEYDKKRDEYLSSYGITVLRFLNSEFLSNQEGVLSFIMGKIEERKSKNPHPDPLHRERDISIQITCAIVELSQRFVSDSVTVGHLNHQDLFP